MNRENWLLLIDEPIEFQKLKVGVQGFRIITNFRQIYRIYLQLMMEKPKDINMYTVGLGNTKILDRLCPKSLQTLLRSPYIYIYMYVWFWSFILTYIQSCGVNDLPFSSHGDPVSSVNIKCSPVDIRGRAGLEVVGMYVRAHFHVPTKLTKTTTLIYAIRFPHANLSAFHIILGICYHSN